MMTTPVTSGARLPGAAKTTSTVNLTKTSRRPESELTDEQLAAMVAAPRPADQNSTAPRAPTMPERAHVDRGPAGSLLEQATVTRVLDGLAPHLAPGGCIVLTGVPPLGSFPVLPQPLRAVLGWHARGLDQRLRLLAMRRSNVLHVPVPLLMSSNLFAADVFHPNADAYAQWAEQLADALG